MNREINTYDDLLSMLDQYSQGDCVGCVLSHAKQARPIYPAE